jgi:subtilisin-like proprotein convertase family protein
MKPLSSKLRLLALLLGSAHAAHAATIVQTDNANTDIPDGSTSGLARLITITGSSESVASVEISLQIEATPGEDAFLGDLYVYLSNGTDTSVLLNRPGRTSTALAGYGDNQSLNVTFSSTGSGDIHNYRIVLNGNPSTPLGGPLTGTWLPDGRTTDPALVLDTDLPTALLDVFAGADASDDWVLYVADLSGGGEHRLVSWTLTLETVPEPSALLLTLGMLPLLARRRR